MAAEGQQGDGPGIDLRDENVQRAAYLSILMDWGGSDLVRTYEPISQQLGYVFIAALLIVCSYTVWQKIKKWREEKKAPFVPYKVLKPPAHLAEKEEEGQSVKKRVVAVLGGTGFIGSYVVDEFISRGDYHVYTLGRKFRESRTNPDCAALIQVDMLDFDGLVNAFQGVDTVVDTAAAVPNVYSSVDSLWKVNKFGLENVIKAAQTAGVKSFIFMSGAHLVGKLKDPQVKAIANALKWTEEHLVKINGEKGMRTCALCPGNVVGLRSFFFDDIFSGKLTSFPMADHRSTFLPVEYLARAVANAEVKMSSGSDDVIGKVHPLSGEVTSFRKFLSLPTWPHKFSSMPHWSLRLMARINVILARTLGWAPFGNDLCPAIASFFEVAEEEVDCSVTYEVLGVGPPPSMEEYIKTLTQRYKEMKEEDRKKK